MTKSGDHVLQSVRKTREIVKKNNNDNSTKRGLNVDVKAIREGFGLSQTAFAKRFGLNASTLREWESGRRIPEMAARILLLVIKYRPDVVEKTLSLSKVMIP